MKVIIKKMCREQINHVFNGDGMIIDTCVTGTIIEAEAIMKDGTIIRVSLTSPSTVNGFTDAEALIRKFISNERNGQVTVKVTVDTEEFKNMIDEQRKEVAKAFCLPAHYL